MLDKVGQHAAAPPSGRSCRCEVAGVEPVWRGGQGFGQLIAHSVQERLIIAAQASGAMNRAVEETVAYVKSRRRCGHSLFEFQNTAFELAECQNARARARCSSITASRSTCAANSTRPRRRWPVLAHRQAVRSSTAACSCTAARIHARVPRGPHVRGRTVPNIYAGANEVMKGIIAKSL
ncbi:hypothetical protein GS493_21725 [Rhodococcus hoagii]|nr:hypothetical protein [Prescottella equi]